MKIFIYELTDPITNQPRYVGKTNNLSYRLYSHTHKKENTHKGNWIQSLKNKGKQPIIQVIDEVDEEEWKFWERRYISLYKSWGFCLTNGTIGGDGFECG